MSSIFLKSKKFLVLSVVFVFCNTSCSANEIQNQKNITRYLELYETYPQTFGPMGDWKKGEMELVVDLPTMMKIQAQYAQPVGIVAEDTYWIWIRDAIILPSGESTAYNRFIPKCGLDGTGAALVLAVTPNNEILVNLIYRHATRSWEIELPRGTRKKGESTEMTAGRGVKEETGYRISEILRLGILATDSGQCTNFIEAFFAKIDKLEEPNRDKEAAIASVMTLSKDKVIDVFCKGQMELVVNGQKITAYCRDAFFAYAVLLAEKKGLL